MTGRRTGIFRSSRSQRIAGIAHAFDGRAERTQHGKHCFVARAAKLSGSVVIAAGNAERGGERVEVLRFVARHCAQYGGPLLDRKDRRFASVACAERSAGMRRATLRGRWTTLKTWAN